MGLRWKCGSWAPLTEPAPWAVAVVVTWWCHLNPNSQVCVCTCDFLSRTSPYLGLAPPLLVGAARGLYVKFPGLPAWVRFQKQNKKIVTLNYRMKYLLGARMKVV